LNLAHHLLPGGCLGYDAFVAKESQWSNRQSQPSKTKYRTKAIGLWQCRHLLQATEIRFPLGCRLETWQFARYERKRNLVKNGSAALIATARWDDGLKRAFDIVVAATLLIVASPIFLVVAVLIALDTGLPIFFRQRRVGKDGRIFEICKFRTMVVEAERIGPCVTSADDARITRVGRILRLTKIDELPQLWNVIVGDMSLVGPRPQVPRYVNLFPSNQKDLILSVLPGMTGPTALAFRHEEEMLQDRSDREDYYVSVLVPIKCRLDVEYIESRSFAKDFGILWKTLLLVVRGAWNRVRRKPMGRSVDRAIISVPVTAPAKPQLELVTVREEPAVLQKAE
jgi:lipopolysaccharide/colanic/teichoic acid biosynthesis glycosyltransferase